MTIAKHWDIEDIKRAHTGFFFSPPSMRMFKSRILSGVTLHKGKLYFVTSERCGHRPRMYTVRCFDPAHPLHMEKVGRFNASSKEGARGVIKALLTAV